MLLGTSRKGEITPGNTLLVFFALDFNIEVFLRLATQLLYLVAPKFPIRAYKSERMKKWI